MPRSNPGFAGIPLLAPTTSTSESTLRLSLRDWLSRLHHVLRLSAASLVASWSDMATATACHPNDSKSSTDSPTSTPSMFKYKRCPYCLQYRAVSMRSPSDPLYTPPVCCAASLMAGDDLTTSSDAGSTTRPLLHRLFSFRPIFSTARPNPIKRATLKLKAKVKGSGASTATTTSHSSSLFFFPHAAPCQPSPPRPATPRDPSIRPCLSRASSSSFSIRRRPRRKTVQFAESQPDEDDAYIPGPGLTDTEYQECQTPLRQITKARMELDARRRALEFWAEELRDADSRLEDKDLWLYAPPFDTGLMRRDDSTSTMALRLRMMRKELDGWAARLQQAALCTDAIPAGFREKREARKWALIRAEEELRKERRFEKGSSGLLTQRASLATNAEEAEVKMGGDTVAIVVEKREPRRPPVEEMVVVEPEPMPLAGGAQNPQKARGRKFLRFASHRV